MSEVDIKNFSFDHKQIGPQTYTVSIITPDKVKLVANYQAPAPLNDDVIFSFIEDKEKRKLFTIELESEIIKDDIVDIEEVKESKTPESITEKVEEKDKKEDPLVFES